MRLRVIPNPVPFGAAMLIVALALSSIRPAVAAEPGDKTLILTQMGDCCGNTVCYINQRGIKLTIVDSKAYLVARAPKWDVMFCNDTNKKMVKMSLEGWLEHVVQMSYAASDWDRFKLVLKPLYKVNQKGRALTRFLISGQIVEGRTVACLHARNADYFVFENAPAAEQACFIMEKALSTPKVTGIPVEFTNHRKVHSIKGYDRDLGGVDHWLTTLTIKEGLFPQTFFSSPSGYKQVSKEVEVMDDKERKKNMDDVIKDLLPNH